MTDFEKALSEVKPAFGAVTETLEQYRLNGIIDSGQHFKDLSSTLKNLVEQVRCRRALGLHCTCGAAAHALIANTTLHIQAFESSGFWSTLPTSSLECSVVWSVAGAALSPQCCFHSPMLSTFSLATE